MAHAARLPTVGSGIPIAITIASAFAIMVSLRERSLDRFVAAARHENIETTFSAASEICLWKTTFF
jgi:hypothetical protein